jgi:hypothetical protein
MKFGEIPIELRVSIYTVAFKVEVGEDCEVIPSEFARFVETAYVVLDKETDKTRETDSVIHSMN